MLQAQDRTLDFHVHENSDEMFYCIEGEFDIEFEDGLTHLCEGDFIIIPKGTKHRPICRALVKCLLIEVEGLSIKKIQEECTTSNKIQQRQILNLLERTTYHHRARHTDAEQMNK